jgi:membrane dipeptidase
MAKPIIVDAHEDIAWNHLALRRDITNSVQETRRVEGVNPEHGEGSATVGLPDFLAGNVRLVFATLFVAPADPGRKSWGDMYSSPEQAHDQAMQQLAYYGLLATDPRVTLVTSRADLDAIVKTDKPGLGLIVLMEGADPIVTPAQTADWFQGGVRIVGPAWSQTRYSGGTRAPGGLTTLGRELMPELERNGIILDTSHMAEQSFWDALELYHGPVIASHSNCRTFVNTDRQLSDDMIKALVQRDAVIGTVMYNRFLKEGWEPSAGKDAVSFEHVVRHMRHICDLAGDARHIGIGSDFDGGFGMESTPKEIDTVADLAKLADALTGKFGDEDIANILGGNWVRFLGRALPA